MILPTQCGNELWFIYNLPISQQKHLHQMLPSVFAAAEPVDFQGLMLRRENVRPEQPLWYGWLRKIPNNWLIIIWRPNSFRIKAHLEETQINKGDIFISRSVFQNGMMQKMKN